MKTKVNKAKLALSTSHVLRSQLNLKSLRLFIGLQLLFSEKGGKVTLVFFLTIIFSNNKTIYTETKKKNPVKISQQMTPFSEFQSIPVCKLYIYVRD